MKILKTMIPAAAMIIAVAGMNYTASAGKLEIPTLTCVGETENSINIQFTAGSSGAAAGFSLQYMTLEAYDAWLTDVYGPAAPQHWGAWPTDTSLFCKVSMSGNANLSQWDLGPFQTRTYTVGYTDDSDPGVSFSCNDPLECGTAYVFRAFAHNVPKNKGGQKKSDWSDVEICATSPCDGGGNFEPCAFAVATYSQGGFFGGSGLVKMAGVEFPVVIGSTHTITFTSATAITALTPAGQGDDGTAVLEATYTDPTGKIGNLASQTLALTLNLAINDACFASAVLCDLDSNVQSLGGLVLTTDQSGALESATIASILAAANEVLGGSIAAGTEDAFYLELGQFNQLLSLLNHSYHEGVESEFAKDHVCGVAFEP